MLTSRSQIWYTIFVGPFGARWAALGPPAFAGAAADKLRHWVSTTTYGQISNS